MSDFLYPRLSRGVVSALHAELRQNGNLAEMQKSSATSHPLATYGQTGGQPVPESRLAKMKQSIEAMAAEAGFPDRGTQQSRSEFDARCAALLLEDTSMMVGEALREDVWSFIAAVMLPHVVIWRFPNFNAERLRGGVRNTFQRLWLRAFLLDRGDSAEDRWGAVRELTEDTFTSILERPGISNNPVLALAIAEAWIRARDLSEASRMMDINRTALVQVRAMYPVLSMETLEPGKLSGLLDEIYARAIQSEMASHRSSDIASEGVTNEKAKNTRRSGISSFVSGMLGGNNK